MSQSLLSALAKSFDMKDPSQQKRFSELSEMIITEQNTILKKKIQDVLRQEYTLGISGHELKVIRDLEDKNSVLLAERRSIINYNGYLWITFNPKSSVSLENFIKKTSAIAKYTCFTSAAWVYEQRGTKASSDIGKGMHCHMLCRRNLKYKPTTCKQKVQRGCQGLMNVKSGNLLNMQIIGADFASDKIKYILGKKSDPKLQKQNGDIIWRKKNNIDICYNKCLEHLMESIKSQAVVSVTEENTSN